MTTRRKADKRLDMAFSGPDATRAPLSRVSA